MSPPPLSRPIRSANRRIPTGEYQPIVNKSALENMGSPRISALTLLDLPEVIMEQILVRFPVRSLLQLKCVCRSWCSLISSNNFIQYHLMKCNKDLSFAGRRIIYVGSKSTYDTMKHCSLSSLITMVVEEVAFDFPIENPKAIQIVGSCDGLVCLTINGEYFCLWNPSTRKFKRLPHVVEAQEGDFVIEKFGFSFDELNKDYKILASVCKGARGALDMVTSWRRTKVYSLKSNSWKSIEVFPGEYPSYYRNDYKGKFWGGKLYWPATVVFSYFDSFDLRNEVCFSYLDSFDLRNEVWGKMELPKACHFILDSHFGLMGGNLSVVCDISRVSIDVWVLKQCDLEESWIKVFTIPHYGNTSEGLSNASIFTPTYIETNGRIVLVMGYNSFIIYEGKEKAGSACRCPPASTEEGLFISLARDEQQKQKKLKKCLCGRKSKSCSSAAELANTLLVEAAMIENVGVFGETDICIESLVQFAD